MNRQASLESRPTFPTLTIQEDARELCEYVEALLAERRQASGDDVLSASASGQSLGEVCPNVGPFFA